MAVGTLGETRDPEYGFFEHGVGESDPEVDAALRAELARQQDQIELIASENIVSCAVLEAAGSVLTNKYAEGYPGRRYYGGCEFVDVAEALAIERAKALFDCGFANVQPHSGAQANAAVYFALCRPGDTILGLSLAAGGHLTHGAAPNLSGKWFEAVQYGVRPEDGRIDIDEVARLAASSAARRSSSPGGRPIRGSSTSPPSGRSPMRSAPICSSTWPISPGSSRAGSIPARCPMPMS